MRVKLEDSPNLCLNHSSEVQWNGNISLLNMQGLVLKTTGSWFIVETENKIYKSRVRGQLRLKDIVSTNPVAAGDLVEVEEQQDGTAVITDILPRKNYIIRKSVNLSRQTQIIAANIDMLWLVVTPELPKTSTGFIDRVIAAAESFQIPVSLLFNKADLFKEELAEVLENYISIYSPLGYKCLMVSAVTGENIDEFRSLTADQVNLLAGHSGVGKSSLVNAINPEMHLKVTEISRQHLKGKHTTTFAEMHKLPYGGYLIDTPGIREFVNIDFKPSEISHYFVEMRALIHDCRFHNCLHENEKDCAIKDAVEAGTIHPMRYYNYLSMLHHEDVYR